VTSAQCAFKDMDVHNMTLDQSTNIFYDDALVYARMMALKSANCVRCSATHASVADLQVSTEKTPVHARERKRVCERKCASERESGREDAREIENDSEILSES